MSRWAKGLSLFEQSLDRAAAVVYFLGAVVPLGALVWLWTRELRPADFDLRADWFIAALGLIGCLTLLSFFALRRLTRSAMSDIARRNETRARMLVLSRALAAAKDADEALGLAAAAMAEAIAAAEGVIFRCRASGELEPHGPDSAAQNPHLVELATAAREASVALAPTVRAASPGRRGHAVAVPCASGGRAAAVLAAWAPAASPHDRVELDVLETLGSLTAVALQNADLREAERNFFTHATNLVVVTLDRYLDDRSDHSRRVASLANEISRMMQIPEARRERLYFAAMLHDIGMLHIPRTHADDRVLARRHVELGDEMLRPISVWQDLAPFVRHHHERWDGNGYPDGLSGEQIPLESRIIAVAEAFDVMTSAKSYQSAISVAEAVGRLEQAAGTQFDPAVVRAFVSVRRDAT